MHKICTAESIHMRNWYKLWLVQVRHCAVQACGPPACACMPVPVRWAQAGWTARVLPLWVRRALHRLNPNILRTTDAALGLQARRIQ